MCNLMSQASSYMQSSRLSKRMSTAPVQKVCMCGSNMCSACAETLRVWQKHRACAAETQRLCNRSTLRAHLFQNKPTSFISSVVLRLRGSRAQQRGDGQTITYMFFIIIQNTAWWQLNRWRLQKYGKIGLPIPLNGIFAKNLTPDLCIDPQL